MKTRKIFCIIISIMILSSLFIPAYAENDCKKSTTDEKGGTPYYGDFYVEILPDQESDEGYLIAVPDTGINVDEDGELFYIPLPPTVYPVTPVVPVSPVDPVEPIVPVSPVEPVTTPPMIPVQPVFPVTPIIIPIPFWPIQIWPVTNWDVWDYLVEKPELVSADK